MMRDVEDRLRTLAAMWRKEEAAETAVNAGKSRVDKNPFAAGRASAFGHCAAQIEALSALTPQVGLDREEVRERVVDEFGKWNKRCGNRAHCSIQFIDQLTDAIIAMLGGPESMGSAGVSEQGRPVAEGLGSAPLERALHDALAIMRRASDVLADYPEHETLTQSLRASCRKAFEALPHCHGVGSDG